jgi:hypothetical protein
LLATPPKGGKFESTVQVQEKFFRHGAIYQRTFVFYKRNTNELLDDLIPNPNPRVMASRNIEGFARKEIEKSRDVSFEGEKKVEN